MEEGQWQASTLGAHGVHCTGSLITLPQNPAICIQARGQDN